MKLLTVLLFLFAAPTFAAPPLFTADFEDATTIGNAATSGATTIADFTRIVSCVNANQVQIVNNPVRQGKYSARIRICDECPTNYQPDIDRQKQRCEIRSDGQAGTPQYVGKFNETRWYAWSVLMPTTAQFQPDDRFDVPGGWYTMMQLVHDEYGSGKASLHFMPTTSNLFKVEIWGGPGDGVRTIVNLSGDMEAGVWHDFVMEMKLHNVNGSAKTLIKRRKTPIGGTPTAWTTAMSSTAANMRNADPSSVLADLVHYFKLGFYGGDPTNNGVQTQYVDGPWIGMVEADVLPFFDVAGGTVTIPAPANITFTP
jgi:hypothetical protein